MPQRHSRRSILDRFVFEEPDENYGCGFRHLIAVLSLLTALVTYIQRFSFGLILAYMATMSHVQSKTDSEACERPSTTFSPQESGEFDWDQETLGYLTLSFFVGYVLSQVVGGYLAERFGPKYVVSGCLLLSTVGTLLAPVSARGLDWAGLTGVRFFIGLVQGPIFPCMSVVLSEWSPKRERAVMGTLMFAGAQLGIVASCFITPPLIDRWDWSAAFYTYGIVGVCWVFIWWILFYNYPVNHPWISEKEKNYIIQNTGRTGIKDLPPTPWKHIFTSVPVWALVFAQFGHDWGLFTIVPDLPKYFRQVFNLNLKENGLFSAAPYMVLWFFAIAFAYLSDWMTGPKQMNVTLVRKLLITIASIGPAIGIIGGSYVGCGKLGAVLFFSLGMGTMGAFIPSLKVNPLDLSPNYSGVVMAVVNALGSISGIMAPHILGQITKDGTLKQWRIVFWLTFVVLLVANVIYIIWGTAKVQPWNDTKEMKPREDT